jgi:hypothetical protein
MPRIVVFDEAASPQRVIQVTGSSENEGPWIASGRTDFVSNPDLSALEGLVPLKYWKHEAGAIVEYTQAEKDAQDAADASTAAQDALDAIAASKADATVAMDGTENLAFLMRAFADVVKEEINILRALHSLPDRTLAQLRTAIANKVNSGDVDT